MRHEIGIAQPEYLIEDWPGKYEIFSWLEYVVTVPNPIFIITTRKANGAPNANLKSWGLLIGEKGNYSSVLHLVMDEVIMVPDPVERVRAMNLMYNVRSTVNPLNGEQYGPNTLGLLNKVEKI